MVRKERRNVGEREYVPRNAVAAALLGGALVSWFSGHVPNGGTVGLWLLAFAAYFYLTARKEWDPAYALLRIRTGPKPLRAAAR